MLPGGTVVKAGTSLFYLPWIMGRLDRCDKLQYCCFNLLTCIYHSLWPNAATFDPERWLTDAPEPSPFKYIAFNAGLQSCDDVRGHVCERWCDWCAGPRLCLGQSMAYVEAKMVVAMVLQQFEVMVSPGERA